MDVVPPLIAHLEAPKAVQPRQSALYHPPVPAQPFARLDPTPGDAGGYAPLPQGLAAPGEVVALTRVQLLWAPARATARLADRRDGVHGLLQRLGIVDVGGGLDYRERDAPSVDHSMALRALFAAIRRVLAGLLAPRGLAPSPSPKMPAPNRSRPPAPGGPRASGASASTRRPYATPPGAANRSYPSRTPSPEAASPKVCCS